MYNISINKILKLNSNKKGASEVISQVLIILIVAVIVGLIINTIIPTISTYNSKLTFEKAQDNINKINNTIIELNNKPINSKIEINLNLEKQNLFIDSINNKLEISHIIKGDYFKKDYIQQIDNIRYNYREDQKLISVADYNSINILRTKEIENKNNVKLIITKKNKIDYLIDIENLHENLWFETTYSNNEFSYSNLNTPGEWLYRKAILIDKNKVEDTLNNFPILIDLENDLDLYNLAKADGSDIIFTDEKGNKLEREIELFEKNIFYRKKIIMDHTKVEEDLENFPLLISTTDLDLKNLSKETGTDIYFEDSLGNKLEREIEDFNKETGELIVWIKIPEISSTINTEIYMYFGNENHFELNSSKVWDENYNRVYHNYNSNNNELIIKDSTINKKDAQKLESAQPLEINGKIGHAQDFDGINDYLQYPQFTFPINGTISFWAELSDVTSIEYMLGSNINNSGFRYDGSSFLIYNNSSGYNTINWDNTFDWTYITIRRINTNDYNLFVNGNYLGVLIAGTNNDDIIFEYMGKRYNGYNFDGSLDEIRFSNTLRSNAWIKTEYNNQNEPNNFYNISEKEQINLNTKYDQLKKKVIVDYTKVKGDLEDFPLLIKTTNLDLKNNSRENGEDIYFVDIYGNKLEREIEYFNKETGELVAWVKIPKLYSTKETIFYMFYGNEDNLEQNSSDIWDTNYIAVWHKNDYNNTTILDSTKNNNTGTKKDINEPNQIEGKIGFAQNYNNNFILVGPEDESLGLNDELSVFAWTYVPDTVPDGTRVGNIIGKYNIDPHFNLEGHTYGKFRVYWNKGQLNFYSTDFDMRGEWHYLGFTRNLNTNEIKMYIDGIINQTATAGSNIDITWPLKIGDDFRSGDNPAIPFHGIIDEVRISNIERSIDWINTEYNNQNDPDSFYSIIDEDTKTIQCKLIAWVNIPELKNNENTLIYMYFGNENHTENNSYNTWNNNYVAIHHLEEESENNETDAIKDSTKYQNNGTANNFLNDETSNIQSIGKIGYSSLFGENAEEINIGNKDSLKLPNYLTFQAWIKLDNLDAIARTIYAKNWSYDWFYTHTNHLTLYLRTGPESSYTSSSTSTGTLTTNWHLVVGTYNSDENKFILYIDGINKKEEIKGTGENQIYNNDSKIGRFSNNTTNQFVGKIDEFRISNIILSPEWIKTEYNNQNDPNSFYNLGKIEYK